MTLLRVSSISLRFPRLVGMVVMDLRVASLARILGRKAQVVQIPEATEVDHLADLDLASKTAATEAVLHLDLANKMAATEVVLHLADLDLVSKTAAMEVVLHLVDLDLANNKVRLLADHQADHQAARVLAKTQHLEIQDLAAAEDLLVPRAMVNQDRRGVQATAAMEVLRAVRVLAKTAKTVVPVLVHLAARAARAQVLATVEAARAQVPTADLVRVPTAMARTRTPQTTLVQRTKGKAAVQFLAPPAAQARAQTGMARAQTPETALAHRTKGRAVP
jgi:hypothetical protein